MHPRAHTVAEILTVILFVLFSHLVRYEALMAFIIEIEVFQNMTTLNLEYFYHLTASVV
jgi:hypothetical protein